MEVTNLTCVLKAVPLERKNHSRGTASRRVPHLENEMDQMRRAMEEMMENMRRMNRIDDLVHRTDSPFITSINSHPLPSKFKMPSLDSLCCLCVCISLPLIFAF